MRLPGNTSFDIRGYSVMMRRRGVPGISPVGAAQSHCRVHCKKQKFSRGDAEAQRNLGERFGLISGTLRESASYLTFLQESHCRRHIP